MGEQIEEERVSGMSKNITDRLRYAYEAYCRGDSEGTVDTIDVDIEDFIVQIKLRSIHHCVLILVSFSCCARLAAT
jgi:hypothetical protein